MNIQHLENRNEIRSIQTETAFHYQQMVRGRIRVPECPRKLDEPNASYEAIQPSEPFRNKLYLILEA